MKLCDFVFSIFFNNLIVININDLKLLKLDLKSSVQRYSVMVKKVLTSTHRIRIMFVRGRRYSFNKKKKLIHGNWYRDYLEMTTYMHDTCQKILK